MERLKGALRALFLNIGITVLKPPLVRGGAPKERRGFYIVIASSFHSSRMTVKVYTIYYALPSRAILPTPQNVRLIYANVSEPSLL